MPNTPIIGRQIAAGRVLAGVGPGKLAQLAGLPTLTLKLIEANDGVPAGLERETRAAQDALERLGVVFIAEDNAGLGVRLKFTRSDVRQIARLEGEGGIAAEDDV